MEAMRYQAKDSAAKTLWVPMVSAWGSNGNLFEGMETAVLWANQQGPWAYFTIDTMIYNGEGFRVRNVHVGSKLRTSKYPHVT